MTAAIARDSLVSKEEHVWYRLDLTSADAAAGGSPEIDLRRVDEATLGAAGELPWGGAHGVAARLRQSADGWIALVDGVAAFGCWVFRGTTPVRAARDGRLRLPDGSACIEDVFTQPAFRGRGLAPAAFAAISGRLRAEGVSTVVAKVEADNGASRRAFEKAGFSAAAAMSFRRVGPWHRLRVRAENDPYGRLLADALAERAPAAAATGDAERP